MWKRAILCVLAAALAASGGERRRTWVEEVHYHVMRSLRAVGREMVDMSRAMHTTLAGLPSEAAREAERLVRDGRRGLRSVTRATSLATRRAMRRTHQTLFAAARVVMPVPEKPAVTRLEAVVRKLEAPILDPAFLRAHDIIVAWHLRAADAPFRKSLVREDRVFLENTANDVYSFDARSGIVQWIYALPGPSSGDFVADESNLYVVASDTYFEVDQLVGRARQKIVLPFPASNTPTLTPQWVILNSWERRIYALNRENRVREWTYTTEANVTGALAIAPRMIYYGDLAGNVCGFAPGQNHADWTYKANDAVRVSLTSAGGFLIFPADDCFVHCVSRFSGQRQWKFPVEGKVTRPVWVAGEVIYFAADGDGLYAVARTDGKLLWKCPGGRWPVALGTENIYIQGGKNELWCVARKSGKKLWAVSVEPFTYLAPNHSTDHIYLTSQHGEVYALYLRADHIEKKAPPPVPEPKVPKAPPRRPRSPEPGGAAAPAPTAP